MNIEEDAGVGSSFSNELYQQAGAKIVKRDGAFASNIILKVRQPTDQVRQQRNETFSHRMFSLIFKPFQDLQAFPDKSTLISFIYPVQNKPIVDQLAKKHATVFAMGKNSTFFCLWLSVFKCFNFDLRLCSTYFSSSSKKILAQI